ncbi:MAG TPA: hypothetical protein VE130_03545 [Nitrososphaeraceae archaeon]|nr:hypothetical protein [Nitrososphaeraceae archaeon]
MPIAKIKKSAGIKIDQTSFIVPAKRKRIESRIKAIPVTASPLTSITMN